MPTKVMAFMCKSCGELIKSEDVDTGVVDLFTAYECNECETLYDDEEDATLCCKEDEE